MQHLWKWTPVPETVPSMTVGKLSDESKEWVKASMQARTASNEMKEQYRKEMGMPATQEQCRLLAERLWRHEFLLQGLSQHLDKAASGANAALGQRAPIESLDGPISHKPAQQSLNGPVMQMASVQSLNAVSAHLHEQLEVIELRQSQQDIRLNELVRTVETINCFPEVAIQMDPNEALVGRGESNGKQNLEAVHEQLQRQHTRHEQHDKRIQQLAQNLEEKHNQLVSQHDVHREQVLAHRDKMDALELRTENIATEVQKIKGSDSVPVRAVDCDCFDEVDFLADSTKKIEEESLEPDNTHEQAIPEVEAKMVISSDQKEPRKSMQDLEDAETSYYIQDSIWDVIIFAGFPRLGWQYAVMIVITGVTNLLIQTLFSLIITVNMTSNELTEDVVKSFMFWRVTAGHQAFASYNPRPLVAQVCNNHLGMSLATGQLNLHQNIKSFLKDQPTELLSGRVSAILCVLVWFFAIMKDIMNNAKFASHVLGLKKSVPKISKNCSPTGVSLEIVSISRGQLITVFSLSVIPRLIISITLGISGALFLGFTRQLTELLLNAVALVFVLDLDELLYVVLVPRAVKQVKDHVQTLASSKSGDIKPWRWIVFRAYWTIMYIVLATVLLSIVHFYLLNPFHDRLLRIDHYLCGGDLNFEFVLNKATGVVMYHPTEPWDREDDMKNYQTEAVLALARLGTVDHHTDTGQNHVAGAVPVSSLELYLEYQMSGKEAIDSMKCSNFASGIPRKREMWATAYMDVLRWEFNDFTLKSCDDIRPEMCQWRSADDRKQKVRSICMERCGCDDPWSGLVDTIGCSSQCSIGFRSNLNSFLTAPRAIREYLTNCSDPPVQLLIEEPGWQNVGKAVARINTPRVGEAGAADISKDLLENGCEGVKAALEKDVDMCAKGMTNTDLRTLKMWCPETCDCKEETAAPVDGFGSDCPPVCIPRPRVGDSDE